MNNLSVLINNLYYTVTDRQLYPNYLWTPTKWIYCSPFNFSVRNLCIYTLYCVVEGEKKCLCHVQYFV